MNNFVLIFAFDGEGAVLLRKKRAKVSDTDWQDGRWNGLGGHVADDDVVSYGFQGIPHG